MAEEKILLPTYKRIDSCAGCGADVYSPELQSRGGWPLMSACSCERGPQLKVREATEDLRRKSRESQPEERAQAA